MHIKDSDVAHDQWLLIAFPGLWNKVPLTIDLLKKRQLTRQHRVKPAIMGIRKDTRKQRC